MNEVPEGKERDEINVMTVALLKATVGLGMNAEGGRGDVLCNAYGPTHLKFTLVGATPMLGMHAALEAAIGQAVTCETRDWGLIVKAPIPAELWPALREAWERDYRPEPTRLFLHLPWVDQAVEIENL